MDLRKLPHLGALKAFEAAARLGSFSRAADELFVTHGAISHQIRALETDLGMALFLREGKRIRLSEAGARYARSIRVALTDIALATQALRGGNRERRLIVSILPSFAARWLTPRIGRFIEKHPEIDLELLSTIEPANFDRDDIDVGLRFGFGVYPGLHAEPLLDETLFPACAPTFNGARLPATPADLAHFTLLRSEANLWRAWFDAAHLRDWPEPSTGVLYQDSSMLLQAAIDGQGIALVRRSLAMHEIIAGRLTRLFDIDGPSPWSYWLVCAPQMADCHRVAAFRAWLAEECAAFRALYRTAPAAAAAGLPANSP